MWFVSYLIALCTCLAVCLASSGKSRPLVKTDYGKVRGHVMKSYGGRDFYAFNGIPYAKPPVGNLRFKNPVSPSKYDGVLDASVDAEDCFQEDAFYNQYKESEKPSSTAKYVGDEDCLYLNIYTPKLIGEKLPVMVFIHGGGYKYGSGASELQGPQFFMDKDIVLVTINYRLEILGFLRADDTYLSGNQGLKDQSAALRWIKENIDHFNGDTNSITIFGESAGGASVNFQTIAPSSKGLFNRAISQSGFVHCSWSIQSLTKAKEHAETLATALGCPTQPQLLLNCLQDKSVLEIYQAYTTFEPKLPHVMVFKPVLENEVPGAFVTKHLMEKGSNVPWMIGINSGEGIMKIQERLLAGDNDLSILNQTYEELLPTLLYINDKPGYQEDARKMKRFYLGDLNFSMDNSRQISELFGDGMFSYGFYKSGLKHRGQLYRYLFSHKGQRSFFGNLQHLDLGVSHGDELHLEFYSTLFYSNPDLNQADSKVSSRFLQLWTNFAKYGNPTPEGSEVVWPESSGSSVYLDIATDGLKVSSDLYKERFEFWSSLDKSLGKTKPDEL